MVPASVCNQFPFNCLTMFDTFAPAFNIFQQYVYITLHNLLHPVTLHFLTMVHLTAVFVIALARISLFENATDPHT